MSSIERRPFRGLLFRKDLPEVFYGEKIFKKSSTERRPFRPFKGLLSLKEKIFQRPFTEREDLSEVFCLERRSFRPLLWGEDLSDHFYEEKPFQRDFFILSGDFRNEVCGMREKLLQFFNKSNRPSLGFYKRKVLLIGLLWGDRARERESERAKTVQRSSIARRGFLWRGDLSEVFYEEKAFQACQRSSLRKRENL